MSKNTVDRENSIEAGTATPVLDPFLGCGSTVIATHLLARKQLEALFVAR